MARARKYQVLLYHGLKVVVKIKIPKGPKLKPRHGQIKSGGKAKKYRFYAFYIECQIKIPPIMCFPHETSLLPNRSPKATGATQAIVIV